MSDAGAATQHPPHGRACNRCTEGRHAALPDPLPAARPRPDFCRSSRPATSPPAWTGPPPTTPSPSSTAGARSPSSSSSTPPAPACASWCAGCAAPASARSRSTRRRPGRRRPARRRPHRGGDQPEPAEEPARPLRLGREQGRPVRRVRAGRHPAHRPARLRPLTPDSPATVTLRDDRAGPQGPGQAPGRAGQPAARPPAGPSTRRRSGCSPSSTAPTSLTFLARFACQDRADWLTPKRLARLAARVGYCGRKDPAALHAHLSAAPPRRDRRRRRRGRARHPRAAGRADRVDPQIDALDAQIAEQLDAHADAHIFTSLPRAGTLARRPAAGRDRRLPRPLPHPRIARLPRRRRTLDPAIRQERPPRSAGPPTNNSATPSATSPPTPGTPAPGPPSSTTGPAARGQRHPHAVRILARAWLHVIWRCWQDHQPTTPPATAPSRPSCTNPAPRRGDRGLTPAL